MTREYPTALHRWFEEVWNQGKTETIREMLTEETVHHGLTGPGGEPVKGIAAFEEFHQEFLTAFPDLHIDIHDVVTEGDRIAARYTVAATNSGPLQGRAATGKKVEFTGSGVCIFRDGKFDEVWNEVDFSKMEYDLADDTPDIK